MRLKNVRVLGLSLAAAAVLAGGVLAQRGFGLLGNPAFLVSRPEVQADLKLTDEQKKKAGDLREYAMGQFQGLRDKLQNASGDERRKVIQDLTADLTKRANEFLMPDQQKRLRQISLQQQGPGAMEDPEVAASLKLTDDQKSKLRELVMQQQQQIREAFQAQDREKIQSIRKETADKALALLTPDQQKQWKEMLGTELKLAPGGGF